MIHFLCDGTLIEYLAVGPWDEDEKEGRTVVRGNASSRAALSLDDFFKQNGHLSPEDACMLLRIIARTIHALHSFRPRSGFMHRDIKPDNVLLFDVSDGPPNETLWRIKDVTWRPVVADLGLAKQFVDPGDALSTIRMHWNAQLYVAGAISWRKTALPEVDI